MTEEFDEPGDLDGLSDDVDEPTATAGLGELVDRCEVLVCTGTGGVGKTSTAAAIAVEAAQRGRRAVVVTIDPAKRLADALGLGIHGLSNTPSRIAGPWPGELWAMMLDTKSTFDDLVHAQATDAQQAERILANRLYQNLSAALSGTQEYMAMEKLYELHTEARFDLVVVDTPPTRHALDFLDAPRRLTRFLDHRLYRLLMTPTKGLVKAVNAAAQAFVRTVSKVVGADVIDDAITFFAAFGGMEEGFKRRAAAVAELLASPATAFVLVATPRGDTIAEATYFAERLHEGGIAVRALVVNRMHPHYGLDAGLDRSEIDHAVQRHAGRDLGALYANLRDLWAVAEHEERHLDGLAQAVAPAPVVRVPIFPSDVHDVEGLELMASYLFR